MKETYKILKYLRLSIDDDGDGESNSIQYQRKLIDGYIDEHFKGKQLYIDEIVDDGYSGTNFRRPGITRALELLNSGKFNCIIVKDLSRLGRDHIQIGNYLEHIFPAMEIRVISINDQYDSDEHIGSPGGIDIALKNLIYELYSKDLSQKVKAARQTIMKSGKYNAPFAIYGYFKQSGTLIIDENTAPIVARIFDMIDSGFTTTQVASILNDEGVMTPAEYKKSLNYKRKWIRGEGKIYWTDSTIRRIISDEKYTGKMVLGKTERLKVGDPCSARRKSVDKWIVVENTHPAIVSQAKFESVGKKVHTHIKHHGNNVNHKTNIYYCANCGHALSKSGKINVALKCRYSIMSSDSKCVNEYIQLNEIKSVLGKILVKQFGIMQSQAKAYKENIETNSAVSLDSIKAEIEGLKRQRFSTYEKFKDGNISREELDEVRSRISNRLDELDNLLKTADKKEEVSELKTHKAEIILNYGDEDVFDDNFINYFVKKVMVHKDKQLDITWNFGLGEFLDETGGNLYA